MKYLSINYNNKSSVKANKRKLFKILLPPRRPQPRTRPQTDYK